MFHAVDVAYDYETPAGSVFACFWHICLWEILNADEIWAEGLRAGGGGG